MLDGDAGSGKTSYNAELGSQYEGRKANVTTKQKLMDSFGLDLNGNMFSEEKGEEAEVQCGATEPMAGEEPQLQCYSKMNHAEQDSSAGDQLQPSHTILGEEIIKVGCTVFFFLTWPFILTLRCRR